MTPAELDQPKQHFRRVILTLSLADDERQDHVLEHTVNFAGVFDTEVACLCIRDSDLLNYAALPFAREFSFQSALSRPLDPEDLRNEMDRRASSIREALEKLATAHQRRHSFSIVEGRLDETAAESTEEDDLLVLTLSPQALRSFKTTYDIISRIVKQRKCHILLLTESQMTSTGDIALIANEALPSDNTLKIALHIAQQRHVALDAYITDKANLAEALEKRCGEIQKLQQDKAQKISVKSLNKRLMHPWRFSPCSLMIMDYEGELPPVDILERSLDVFRVPLLLFKR